MPNRVAVYARVSTADQHPEAQLDQLRRYADARGLEIVEEYVDCGISGSKDRRPALDRLVADSRRRRFDAVACVKLDRLARSVRHLTTLAADLDALGVDLIVVDQAIDTSTPSGRLFFNVLGSIAEFECDLTVSCRLKTRSRRRVSCAAVIDLARGVRDGTCSPQTRPSDGRGKPSLGTAGFCQRSNSWASRPQLSRPILLELLRFDLWTEASDVGLEFCEKSSEHYTLPMVLGEFRLFRDEAERKITISSTSRGAEKYVEAL